MNNNNYNISSKDKKCKKSKIASYQKKILSLEFTHLSKSIPPVNLNKLKLIENKLKKYKVVVNTLFVDSDIYLVLKDIMIDYHREPGEIKCLEMIWMVEHYEFIEEIRKCEDDIYNMIQFAIKYNLISYFQYKFMKKMLKKVNGIFESDKSIENFYDKSCKTKISEHELELFFDILDIILLKIYSHSKNNFNEESKNHTNISKNEKYVNLIKKIKFEYEKILSNI